MNITNKKTLTIIFIIISTLVVVIVVFLLVRFNKISTDTDSGFAATPNKSLFVFSGREVEDINAREIYTIHSDGTNLKRLTNKDRGDEGPVISPDGKKIAFKSNRDDPQGKSTTKGLD